MRELLRPWKLATLIAGLAWLIWGAYHYQLSDWDVGVSVLMATCTYLTAPVSVRILLTRNWLRLPEALFYSWFSVDGVYTLYHLDNSEAMLRSAQWPTSLCLYLLCGCLWLWRGNLAELYQAIREVHA
ncbi:hypothetical protein [Chitinimonas naiadis]